MGLPEVTNTSVRLCVFDTWRFFAPAGTSRAKASAEPRQRLASPPSSYTAATMLLTTAILYVPACTSGTSKVLRNLPVEAFSPSPANRPAR